jgi:hypothetical protein
MQHYYQPKGSQTCGQHCVAMVCGITVDESLAFFNKKAKTKAIDLYDAILKATRFTAMVDSRLKRYRAAKPLPPLAILRVQWIGHRAGHWVVYNNGEIYDPLLGVYDFNKPIIYLTATGKITSYIGINIPSTSI